MRHLVAISYAHTTTRATSPCTTSLWLLTIWVESVQEGAGGAGERGVLRDQQMAVPHFPIVLDGGSSEQHMCSGAEDLDLQNVSGIWEEDKDTMVIWHFLAYVYYPYVLFFGT